ncbi:MAG TPA: hypothetical protein VHW60_07985 [Caulobacteraceae bacterium]|nr:hypothetical protein [Caulobacteraceae bacterium]
MTGPAITGGLAEYARTIFAQADIQPVWDALMARAGADPTDAGALLDLSTILQLVGQRDQGLALQADALARQRWYRRRVGSGDGLRVLALVAAGDMMASTPIEFLLAGWNGELDLLFLSPDAPVPFDIPDHDLAILAVGESDANAPILRALTDVIAGWPRPMLNAAPEAILALGRDRAPPRLSGRPGLVAPPTQRLSRAELAAVAVDAPIIVRPIDSHAGIGLEKLDDAPALAAYLAAQPGEAFYVQPFIDYASPDGRFRKLRVALVDARPFLVHLAISDHWMVHYLNAGMAQEAGKRAEEAAMMAAFDASFAARHAEAFHGLHAAFGLDYVAVDCAEDREGRLLVFEADTAMIVHDMDPPDLYPYKAPAMRRLFAAFQLLVAARAG